MKIEAGKDAPFMVTRHGIVLFAGTYTACERFVDEQRGAAVRFGFAWQPGRTENSARYTKNDIVLARYWLNDMGKWHIAILLPIKGVRESRFDTEAEARKAIETHVAEWFEQVNA